MKMVIEHPPFASKKPGFFAKMPPGTFMNFGAKIKLSRITTGWNGRLANTKKPGSRMSKKILLSMTETLGSSFRQNIIDVYIAPWFHAFSDPLVIGVTKEPDVFVDTLTHELLHRLLTDNTTIPYETDLIAEWRKLFGNNHNFKVLVHIPVHAIHK